MWMRNHRADLEPEPRTRSPRPEGASAFSSDRGDEMASSVALLDSERLGRSADVLRRDLRTVCESRRLALAVLEAPRTHDKDRVRLLVAGAVVAGPQDLVIHECGSSSVKTTAHLQPSCATAREVLRIGADVWKTDSSGRQQEDGVVGVGVSQKKIWSLPATWIGASGTTNEVHLPFQRHQAFHLLGARAVRERKRVVVLRRTGVIVAIVRPAELELPHFSGESRGVHWCRVPRWRIAARRISRWHRNRWRPNDASFHRDRPVRSRFAAGSHQKRRDQEASGASN
jgi:hypothetical protein